MLVTGAALLKAMPWAQRMYLFALGMLAYSVIISSGYLAQQGDVAFVAMFAVLLVVSAVLAAVNLRQTAMSRSTAVHRQPALTSSNHGGDNAFQPLLAS